VKTTLDAWWQDEVNPSSPLIDSGRGPITIYQRAEITNFCEDGSGAQATLQMCGSELPPLLVDANCAVIQYVFPDASWESPGMPKLVTSATKSSFDADGMLTIVKTPGLLGITLGSADAPWPTYKDAATFSCPNGKGAQCFPDQDGDGAPGLTLKTTTTGAPGPLPYACSAGNWEYSTGPLSLLDALDKMSGATDLEIGLRIRFGSTAKLGSDCESGKGSAEAQTYELRVVDCKTSKGACTAAGALFLDQNLPSYHVLQPGEQPPATWKHPRAGADAALNRSASKGAVSSIVRLGDIGESFSCAQARRASFPSD
jgi:hypothetical protein